MANIALVGCAHIHTPGFIKRLQARSDVSTAAVWDRDPARAKTCSDQLGAPALDNVDAIWSDRRHRRRHHLLADRPARAARHRRRCRRQAHVRRKAARHRRAGRQPHGRGHRTGRRPLSDRLLQPRHPSPPGPQGYGRTTVSSARSHAPASSTAIPAPCAISSRPTTCG